jgi:hypothetical protein
MRASDPSRSGNLSGSGSRAAIFPQHAKWLGSRPERGARPWNTACGFKDEAAVSNFAQIFSVQEGMVCLNFSQTEGILNENQLGIGKIGSVDRSGRHGRRDVAAVVGFRLHKPEYG